MTCGNISHAYVIFGATGNLATHKLLPALYQLHCQGQLAADVEILGCGRSPFTQATWQAEVRAKLVGLVEGDAHLDGFVQRLDYLAGSLTDPGFYQALHAWVGDNGCENNVILPVSQPGFVRGSDGRVGERGLVAGNQRLAAHGD